MLNFICGRSGSGKTKKVIEMIKKCVSDKKRTYLLVPEQQAFISESMLAFLDPSSALCFKVVSFSRLCDIVFSEHGGVVEASEDGIRNLVMWQTLRELKTASNDSDKKVLGEYNRVKTDAAFTSIMLSTVDELRAGGITAEKCQKAADECTDPRLKAKLDDVTLIYSRYNSRLEALPDGNVCSAENKLSRLWKLLRTNAKEFFKESHIFVDSFTSFTVEERRILFELALQAEDFTITFCRDKSSHGMPHTFSIDDTYRRFLKFAEKVKYLDYKIEHCKLEDSSKDKALITLEKGLWDFTLTANDVKDSFTADPLSAIEAYKCKNEYEELTLTALKILEEHRKGTKFSEMAIILRDAESRKGLIEAIYDKYGIPYFLSERTDISSTAAARLLLSALRCIVYNFRTSDVLTLLKTGLCGVSDEDSDLFEDYVYTWNINGSKFILPSQENWNMNPGGYTTDKVTGRSLDILISANRVRNTLIPPLEKLRNEMLAAKGCPEKLCAAVYNYIKAIGLCNSLTELAKHDLADADVRSANEDLRIYDAIISMLGRIAQVLKEESITHEELLSIVEIMLKGSDVGSVPSVGDYVTVGSAPTLRVENVKIAFVIGLCEGEFPKNYSDSGVFTELDKEALKDILPLSSREKKIISDELFYVYRALTKPSEKLIVSTLSSRIGGGSCTPSTAWNRIFFLFPKIRAYEFDLSHLTKLAQDTGERSISAKDTEIDESENSSEITITPAQIELLFSNKLLLSQSKMNDYAECPYKYWCNYVLELRERKISEISYDNSGTLVHFVLEKLIPSLYEDNNTPHNTKDSEKIRAHKLDIPTEEELVEKVDALVSEYINNIGCELTPSLMYSFSRLRDLALFMAKDVVDEFANSSFKVLATEMTISRYTDQELENGYKLNADELRPININVEVGGKNYTVVLNGKIDRLDLYEGTDGQYIRVVDYKTGKHPFDLDKAKSGDDVQLPAYLFTAVQESNREKLGEAKDIIPASALFHMAKGEDNMPERSGFILNDPEVLNAASPSLDKKVLMGITFDKKSGAVKKGNAVSEDEINQFGEKLRESISNTGKGILSGNVRRTPSEKACRFCKLRATCPVAAEIQEF